jgi:hypothetical protein
MTRLWSLGILAAWLFAGAAHAYVNFNGATGVISLPNANTVGVNTFSAAADLLFFDSTRVDARAAYGITNRVEVGAALNAGSDSNYGLAAKYQLPITPLNFTWALGGSAFHATNGINSQQLYFVGTRPVPFTGTTGVNLYGTVGVNLTWIESEAGFRPFVGGQLLLGPRTQIDAEAQFDTGSFDESTTFSLGLRQNFSPVFSGQVGFTNAVGYLGSGEHSVFVGLSFTQ